MSAAHAHNVAFHAALRDLMKMMEQNATTDKLRAEVAKAENIIKFANNANEYKIIGDSIAYFRKYHTQIENRDEDFFASECDALGKDDATMTSLLSAIKTMYMDSNKRNKDRVYELVKVLRNESLGYAKIIAEMVAAARA